MLDPCDGRRAHWSANSFHILNDNTMSTSIHRRLCCCKAHRCVKQSSILTRWQFFCSLCDRFNWDSLSRNRNSPAVTRANWIWSNLSLPCRLLSSLHSIITKTVSCILVRLIIEMLSKYLSKAHVFSVEIRTFSDSHVVCISSICCQMKRPHHAHQTPWWWWCYFFVNEMKT